MFLEILYFDIFYDIAQLLRYMPYGDFIIRLSCTNDDRENRGFGVGT